MHLIDSWMSSNELLDDKETEKMVDVRTTIHVMYLRLSSKKKKRFVLVHLCQQLISSHSFPHSMTFYEESLIST